MQITKFIDKKCIVPHLSATTKADALKELTHILIDKKKLDNNAATLDQIMAREVTESTGMGHGIAIPHARISGLKQLVCAVGRVRAGIEFNAVDKKPVFLIFLICYPPTQQTTYLNFLATVAKVFRDPASMEAMLVATDEEDLFKILDHISEPLSEPEKFAKQIKTDPKVLETRDAHADLILLARLQLYTEMHDTAKTGKKALKDKVEAIRGMVDPRILRQYDKLMLRRAPAIVPVEGDTCQGCFMKLPSQFAQRVRQESHLLHVCNNCSRFIYVV
jgi:PTS system nitrogen regulatory IIA component